ncbi:synaptotagmin-6-like isoform X1 [Limulus polyphemus]|uniref:Synaptotagmin-6-like isoform X1 n=2 Tax=Limulus polyphemus TaxID=6850 RepID=A0ABM1RWQ6_LIMPO|nr:synaptotagmin-6-like isoform X1 [Limulus polyphemus]
MGVLFKKENVADPQALQEDAGHRTVSQFLIVLIILAVAVVGIMTYFSYRWLVSILQPNHSANDNSAALVTTTLHSTEPSSAPSLKISHSLPDIKEELQKQVHCKKTAPTRQATLPSVPTRHQTFQRQLHICDVPFEICNKATRESPSVGEIKPELYKKDLGRKASTESNSTLEEDGEHGKPCGRIHFTLRYDQDIEGLVVRVLQARDLPVKDFTGSSDPYVKIYLLPDRKKKFQTRVHLKNLNPVFNETFVFGVGYNQLKSRMLQFSVYDFDRFSKHDLIGQVLVKSLAEVCDVTYEMEYIMDIMCAPQDKENLGELMLSLCYLPTAGRLTVTIMKARSLKAMDITGSSDPYVKVSLICQGKRIKKKKTTVKKSTLNPVYNEALVFDVPADNIEDVNLLIKVIDYDRVGANEMLGCCAIGNQCIGLGRDHWLKMLDTPRHPVAQWYPLVDIAPSFLDFSEQSPVKCISIR